MRAASEKPWTERLWIYDLRTNQHFTLKERTLKRSDLEEFVQCLHAENRHERIESERFKGFAYEDLLKRDKVKLDIFWLRDESLEDSANLPDPDALALEIAEELEAALEQFCRDCRGFEAVTFGAFNQSTASPFLTRRVRFGGENTLETTPENQ
jgi:type I restriction enzyme M protein